MMRIKFLIGVPDEFKMNYSFKLTNLGYSPFEPNKYNEKAYVFLNKLSEIESLNLDESTLLRDIEILIFNNPSIFNVLMEKNISRDGIIDLNDPKVLNDFDKFNDGDIVTPEKLKEMGIIKKELTGIKVLAYGELTKKVTIQAHRFSSKALEKIESAGGKAEVI